MTVSQLRVRSHSVSVKVQSIGNSQQRRGNIDRAMSLPMDSVNNLVGKVAIVTGASSGIGKAVAMVLARAGVNVTLAARREDKLWEVESAIKNEGGVAISVNTDVTNRQQVLELVRQTEQTLGPVDILVNNAGVFYYTLMKNLHWEEWDSMIDVNVKGVTNCIGAVLEGMVNRKSGHIVNITSVCGRKALPGSAVYSGTKFYLEGLSNALRHEVCGVGVKVTNIEPGYAETELFLQNTDKDAARLYDVRDQCTVMTADDVANAVLYAVSQPATVAVNEILIEPRELSVL